MELDHIRISNENAQNAIISLLVSLAAQIDVLEMRVSDLANAKPEMSPETADNLQDHFFQERRIRLVTKYGEY